MAAKLLVTMDGKPLITKQKLDQAFDRIVAQTPGIRQMLSTMPELKNQFLEGMIAQEAVNKDVHDKKLDRSSAYQQELKEAIESITLALNTKYFNEQIASRMKVSDAEVLKFYNENKSNMPELQNASFEEAKDGIRKYLDDENRRNNMKNELERLKKEYKIEVVT